MLKRYLLAPEWAPERANTVSTLDRSPHNTRSLSGERKAVRYHRLPTLSRQLSALIPYFSVTCVSCLTRSRFGNSPIYDPHHEPSIHTNPSSVVLTTTTPTVTLRAIPIELMR